MSPFGFPKKSQPEIEDGARADGGFLVFEHTGSIRSGKE
jgi:hypothetical protein